MAVSKTVLSFGMVAAPVKLQKVVSSTEATTINEATATKQRVGRLAVDKDAAQEALTAYSLLPADKRDVQALATAIGNAVLEVPFTPGDKGQFVQKAPRKGVFDKGGTFTEVPVDALTAIDEETKIEALAIEGFIPLSEVPFERAKSCYYLTADGASAASKKPLVLLRDGMKQKGVAGFGKLSLRTAQYAFVLYEKDGGLLLNTIEYAASFTRVKQAAEALEGIELDAKMLAVAGQFIDGMMVDAINLDGIVNERLERREELIAKALAGEKIVVVSAPPVEETDTDNLAELLLASVAANKPSAKKKAAVTA